MKALLSPKYRVIVFLLAMNAAWASAAWVWFSRESWIWIAPIALSINALLFGYDQILKFRSLRAEPLLGNDAWGLQRVVSELSRELEIPVPKVFLIDWDGAQIFTYAKSASSSKLFVSKGALELLNGRQLLAALAFQFVMIRSHYSVLNYWIAGALDLWFRIGKGMERFCAFVFGWSPPIAQWILNPWLWLVHAILLGAGDFERLDFETARILGRGDDLAQALWKLEAYSQTRPWDEPWPFAHMCIVSPLRRDLAFSYAKVQPSLSRRVHHLLGRGDL